jgi:hypothetical protein
MKKLAMIAAIAVFAIPALFDLIRNFANPIGYYSEYPSRLLWVAAIAITAGLVAWSYYKLPPRAQEHARTISLVMAASVATAALGYFIYAFFSLASIVARHGGSFWSPLSMVLPVLLMSLAVSGFCWAAIWRVWRKGVSR